MKKGVRTDGVKLRVNRGLIVLNDLDSGAVWDVDRDQVKIDNWDSVIPPPTTDDKNKKKDENLVDDEQSKTPPKAQNDVHAGAARPHVDPARARQRLRLAGLDPRHLARRRRPGDASADVATSASADGQTVQVTVPEEPTSDTFTFDYTVNNGTTAKNGRATAKVTVTVVGSGRSTRRRSCAPARASSPRSTYPVVAGNAPCASGSSPTGATPRTTRSRSRRRPGHDGRRRRRGPHHQGPRREGPPGRRLRRRATAAAASTPSAVTLEVLSEDETKAVPPRTQPDVLRGVVGKPVQLQPLGNDIPGADPTDPEARMRLASEVKRPGAADHRHEPRHQRAHRDRRRRRAPSTITYAAQSAPGSASVACGSTSCPTPTRSCRPSRRPTRRCSAARRPSSPTCSPTTTARAATCSSSSGS